MVSGNDLTATLLYSGIGTNINIWTLLLAVLYIIGLWRIFEKCGIKGWWALIPVARSYQLGRCSDRALEGRNLAFSEAAIIVLQIAIRLVGRNSTPSPLLSVLYFSFLIINLIYSIRVHLGLISVFRRRKWWILAWITVSGITAIIWGFHKEFKPQWKAEEIRKDAETFFAENRTSALNEGLSISLEDRTVTESFKKKTLLRDIHMYIEPGHMVLLLGGSGAGKTTFVNAVNGYEPANAEILINGRDMYRNYKSMLFNIGFVPQADLMRGSDTVHNTLMDAAVMRLPSSFSKADQEKRVEDVMGIFGLLPARDSMVSKLSGGQRKRLSIAMEFLPNPELFILDEPDSGLDGVMARELFQQLRVIADHGKIIIVITHTPDRVIDLFDDVIVLAKDTELTGRLAWFGPVEEARVFFGREKMEDIVKCINREEEGGEGRADEFVRKYAETRDDERKEPEHHV